MPEIVNTSTLNYTAPEDPNDNREVVVDVKDVTMSFNMASENLGSLKEYFIKLAKRELFFEEFTALDKVSFQVRRGDVFGIMGTNGSGKSTLLKIMAGVLEPTSGTCKVHGNIAPLIELGAGFDTELSARENIYLNGALLGYSHAFIDEHFDDIVEFAEVKKFLDMPMKNYSSGMVSRIAFAIATVIVPEILLVDEVLSVGDLMFQRKCERRITELIEKHGVTVLIVSHSDGQIARLCNKAVWLEKGHVRCLGPASDISSIYNMLGGRTGSAKSEAKIFSVMTNAMERPEPENIVSIDCSPVAKGGVELVRRGWGDNFDTVILIDPSTHFSGVLAAPLSALMGAPVMAYNMEDPALETQYFLSSVAPAHVVAFYLNENPIPEKIINKRLLWNPEVTQIHSIFPLKAVDNIYSYGKNFEKWNKVVTVIDLADNALALAVATQAARAKSPIVSGLMDITDLTQQYAEFFVNEGFDEVNICGPSFPRENIHFFEEAGLKVNLVARASGCDNNNYSEVLSAYSSDATCESPCALPPIKEILLDSYSPSAWYNLLPAPAYLAHTDGALALQDTTNLDSMVETIKFCEQVAKRNEECKVIHLASASGLTERDVKLAASAMKQ